jgi:RND family efflux transporter MFP subunit
VADAGILPRKDAETAAGALADANAGLIAARHNLALSVLRSPIPGVVAAVNATLNAQADPTQTLVQVVDPHGLEVQLSVPPDQASQVHRGSTVHLSSGKAAGGTVLGDGVVTGIAAVIDTANGSVAVRAALGRPVGQLFVGQDVFATIEVARRPGAVVIPAEAVVPEGTGFQVFVVDAKGVAHARPVTLGARHETLVEVVGGVRGGETVVASGAYGVTDGARIRRTGA